MCLQFILAGMQWISAVAATFAITQGVSAQQTNLMKTDPRLVAAYHFAEFSGGYRSIAVDASAHKVTFITTSGAQKEWDCKGAVVPKEGAQQSHCYLRQPNTAIMALDYQCKMVIKDGSTAVSLESGEDRLEYGNGKLGESLLPKWLPEIPKGATLESVRILHSHDNETADMVLKMQVSCIQYYADSLGVDIKGTENELHWSRSQNGSITIISVAADGTLCTLAGHRQSH